jgi:hypothetical protein
MNKTCARSLSTMVLGLGCVLGPAGCGPETADGGGTAGATGSLPSFTVDLEKHPRREKNAFWFTRMMTHESASADNAFLNRDDGSHIHVNDLACFTIGMGGEFCAHDICTKDKVKTRIDANGFYKGRAVTGEQSKLFWGCTAYSNFIGNPGAVAMISNPDLFFENTHNFNTWPACLSNVTSSTTGLWWGDAISWLGGLGRVFNNAFPDFAQVELSQDPFAGSRLRIGSGGCDGNWTGLNALGRSFFVGNPGSGKKVTLMGVNSNNIFLIGHAGDPGTFTFTISSEGGFSSRFMTGVEHGFCALSKFSGQFRGNGEHVRVAAVDTSNGVQWKIVLSKQSGDGVAGSATCIAYDQRI